MPLTTPRLVTPAQQRYIASLAAERVALRDRDTQVAAAANGTLTARDASDLIEALSRQPRSASAPASRDAIAVPAPSQNNRAGRMLNGGGIEATVTLDDGRHVTVSMRTRMRSGRGYANANPGEGNTTIKVLGSNIGRALVDAEGNWSVRLFTRRAEYRSAVAAVFAYAAGTGLPNGVTRVQEASRCGRCFRTLTDPVSIDRGIGPECLGRVTNSRHVALTDRERAIRAEQRAAAPVVDVTLTANAAEFTRQVEQTRERLETLTDAMTTPAPASEFTQETLAVGRAAGLSRDEKRARDLIAEALDAYCSDADSAFAMQMFDRLAARSS